jgi:RsmE family RNA methyltransferase
MNFVTSLDSHCFALHVTNLNLSHLPHEKKKVYRSTDGAFIHRVKTILRLKEDDTVLLFDSSHHTMAFLKKVSPHELIFLVDGLEANVSLQRAITWWLPLFKKEAFEEALYSLTEMGVQFIQPLKTKKAARAWGSPKDYARAQAVMIAACEQSKQFNVPVLYPVKELADCATEGTSLKLFFDATGESLIWVLKDHREIPITACVGPEGDLTVDEKNYLKEHGFIFCKLTSTVLRAQQAVAVGLGILRSL